MDKLIKQSIDSRRDAIRASSEIDAGAQKAGYLGHLAKLFKKKGE